MVVRSSLFHFKTAPGTKPDPVTAGQNCHFPPGALAGDADASLGAASTVLAPASKI